MRNNVSLYMGKDKLRAFFKYPGELLNLSINQLRILTGLQRGQDHLKRQQFKMGLVNSPECERCKRASKQPDTLVTLTLILPRSRTGTVWFYTSTSNKRAARPKLYTKSLTRDLKLMYSRLTVVRISINL